MFVCLMDGCPALTLINVCFGEDTDKQMPITTHELPIANNRNQSPLPLVNTNNHYQWPLPI